MNRDYEETRYQVSFITYDTIKQWICTAVYYTDDFFSAASEAQEYLPDYNRVEIFDSVAGRILFDSSDLD